MIQVNVLCFEYERCFLVNYPLNVACFSSYFVTRSDEISFPLFNPFSHLTLSLFLSFTVDCTFSLG